jgi:hypothetical protein
LFGDFVVVGKTVIGELACNELGTFVLSEGLTLGRVVGLKLGKVATTLFCRILFTLVLQKSVLKQSQAITAKHTTKVTIKINKAILHLLMQH